jgi:hypothetical protein
MTGGVEVKSAPTATKIPKFKFCTVRARKKVELRSAAEIGTAFMPRLWGTAASRLEFLCPSLHLRRIRARRFAPEFGRLDMTLFHSHHGDSRGFGRLENGGRFSASRAIGKLAAALRVLHKAIVAAKMRRLRRELMFHSDAYENLASPTETDVTKIPRCPLILGDKWDF